MHLAGLCALELGDIVRAVELLRAAGPAASVDLAHALLTTGRVDDALAAVAGPDVPQLRARVDIARAGGRPQEALAAAGRLAVSAPGDVLAALDVAELALELGRWAEAAAAFARLRVVDTDEGHAVHAWHGEVEAWAAAGRWRSALEAALGASRADRGALTTDVLTALTAEVFGAAGRQSLPWKVVAPRLAAARAAHRRLHQEAV